MIYRVSIGDLVNVLLDDEMTQERPTPEVARDYIRACSDEALRTYNETPAALIVTDGDDGDDDDGRG